MADIKLDPKVRAVIDRSQITDDLLLLPEGQLDRKFYEQVKKAIKAAGGKWKTNRKGFVFAEGGARAALGLALESGVVVDKKKARQAFYTPMKLAEEVAELADVNGCGVLEPSAGAGALADACIRAGAAWVDCVEIDAAAAEKLAKRYGGVRCGDFLKTKLNSLFYRIVMNPPFTRGLAAKHVLHAYQHCLCAGGILTAIVPDVDEPAYEAAGAVLRVLKKNPPGSFRESGTQVATRIIQFTRP